MAMFNSFLYVYKSVMFERDGSYVAIVGMGFNHR